MTQLELALKATIDRSRLSQAECGYLRLREDELRRIEKALLEEVNGRALLVNAALRKQPADDAIVEPVGAGGGY